LAFQALEIAYCEDGVTFDVAGVANHRKAAAATLPFLGEDPIYEGHHHIGACIAIPVMGAVTGAAPI